MSKQYNYNYIRKVTDRKNSLLTNKEFLITCLECKRKFKRITNTHLKACCNLSMEGYSKRYNLDKKDLLWIPERENHANKMSGVGNPIFGLKRSQETRDKIGNLKRGRKFPKISEALLKLKEEQGYLQSPESRLKQGKSLRKKFAEDTEWSRKRKEEISKQFKELLSNKEYKAKHLKRIRKNVRPNKPEKKMLQIIKENNLPFNYVGNGNIWFKGKNHSFNPDFLSKNPKHIIEVFGDYWHNLPNAKKRDRERLKTYKQYGYKTLVIWEHELKNKNNVLNKIGRFLI